MSSLSHLCTRTRFLGKNISDMRKKNQWIHITPNANIESIRSVGLLPQKSQTDIKRVWLADAGLFEWAVSHVGRHHDLFWPELAVIVVCCPPANLLGSSVKGAVWCREVVPASSVLLAMPLGKLDGTDLA